MFNTVIYSSSVLKCWNTLSAYRLTQRSSVPASCWRDGVEPSLAEVNIIRSSRNQKSAFKVTPIYPKLVRPAESSPSSIAVHYSIKWHTRILLKNIPTAGLVCLSNRRSPRVRHGIRRPRPSSVELTNDLKDMSEGEDVFYTYRASVSSSKDSEGETSPHELVPAPTESILPLSLSSLCLIKQNVKVFVYVWKSWWQLKGESFNESRQIYLVTTL